MKGFKRKFDMKEHISKNDTKPYIVKKKKKKVYGKKKKKKKH